MEPAAQAQQQSGGAESNAAVLHGIEDVRLESRPVGAPGPGQALIRVHSVGICGSDMHYFRRGARRGAVAARQRRRALTRARLGRAPCGARSHAQIKGQKMSLPTMEGFQGVMGHEASGVVEAVGAGVTQLKARPRGAASAS
jgi:threonine dehydrogenase-like Zn-dependent dehydrogenase